MRNRILQPNKIRGLKLETHRNPISATAFMVHVVLYHTGNLRASDLPPGCQVTESSGTDNAICVAEAQFSRRIADERKMVFLSGSSSARNHASAWNIERFSRNRFGFRPYDHLCWACVAGSRCRNDGAKQHLWRGSTGARQNLNRWPNIVANAPEKYAAVDYAFAFLSEKNAGGALPGFDAEFRPNEDFGEREGVLHCMFYAVIMRFVQRDIGAELEIILRREGIGQADLASRIGVNQATISRVLKRGYSRKSVGRDRIVAYLDNASKMHNSFEIPFTVRAAFDDVWNRTIEHAELLARLIRATEGLLPEVKSLKNE